MGDKDGGRSLRLPQPGQVLSQLAAGQLVHRAEGFVQQQQPRLRHQRPGDGGALAHPARQRGGARIAEPLQPHQRDHPVHRCRVGGAARQLQRQRDVAAQAAPGQQRRVLKRHRQPRLPQHLGRGRPGNLHPARAGGFQPGDHPQDGGLAAARSPHQRGGLPCGKGQVQRAHRLGAMVPALGQPDAGNGRRAGQVSGHGPPRGSSGPTGRA